MDKHNEKDIEKFVKEVKELAKGLKFSRISPNDIKDFIAMNPSELLEEYLPLHL